MRFKEKSKFIFQDKININERNSPDSGEFLIVLKHLRYEQSSPLAVPVYSFGTQLVRSKLFYLKPC
ncbi:MAG: hypothetical protein IKB92_05760, partial [Clostridia bacterium]|nr:hypothetical protein [Clostridia bacterium]